MRTHRSSIITMAAAAALVGATSLAMALPASAAAPPQNSQRFERSYQQNDYDEPSLRSGPYRTPQTMEQDAFRQGFEAGRQDARSYYGNQYHSGRGDDRYGQMNWTRRQSIPPSQWGAWRDSSTPRDRAFRAWPGTERGSFAGIDLGSRNMGNPGDTYRAWPGNEAGNYR